MIPAQGFDPNSERDFQRVSNLASQLAPLISEAAASEAANLVVEAMKWGPYDQRSSAWRNLKTRLETSAAKQSGTLEEYGLRALARIVLNWPTTTDDSTRAGTLTEQILDLHDLIQVLVTKAATRPETSFPEIPTSGALQDRLSELSQKLSSFSSGLARDSSQLGPTVWVSRWVQRVSEETRAVIDHDRGGNSIGMLIDQIGLVNAAPANIFDVQQIAAVVGGVRGAVEEWLRDQHSIRLIEPRPYVDLVDGALHEPTYEPIEGLPERMVTRVTRVGYFTGARVTRLAIVCAVGVARPAEPSAAEEASKSPRKP